MRLVLIQATLRVEVDVIGVQRCEIAKVIFPSVAFFSLFSGVARSHEIFHYPSPKHSNTASEALKMKLKT